MERLQRIALFMLLASCTLVSGQSFPKMDEIFLEFYQTEVVLSNLKRDFSALATEYYDGSQGRSVLELLAVGDRLSYYYYNFTNDILEINGTACDVSPLEESPDDYVPPFFGWLNRYPFVIGPSALLWFAQNFPQKVEYDKTVMVRGIKCERFILNVDSTSENVEYKYYFAVKNWTTPYKFGNFRVPIRVEITGASSVGTDKNLPAPKELVVDFNYFKVTIDDWSKLQAPIGLGCFGRKGDRIMPKLPSSFKYSAQIHDMLNEAEPDAISYERVYFDNETMLARVDTWSRKKRSSIVYDFNNGVQYNIQGRTKCSIEAIRKTLFVRDDGHLLTFINSPQQILGLTGDFYFMGYTKYRGIPCSVFEVAKRNSAYQGKFYYLLVVTVFFTQDYTEVITQGEDLMDAPIYLRVTGYDGSNKIIHQWQYNIFGFDDVSDVTIYRNFPIESCFPQMDQRNYFVLILSPEKESDKFTEIASALANNNNIFLDQTRAALNEKLGVSDIRIPFLKADYSESGVYVTGLMLDRPPVLSQFWIFTEMKTKLPKDMKVREMANTLEDCATACVNDKAFLCRRFFFCGENYCLTSGGTPDQKDNIDNELHSCKIYMRGYAGSNTKQPYLTDAISLLEQTVAKKQFSVTVPLMVTSTGASEVVANFNDLIIGEGPYVKDITDSSYKMVAENYQLISGSFVETTIDRTDYDTMMDCYQICKDETSLSCASFSFCPNSKNKNCRISSLVVVNADSSFDDIEESAGCNVYSIMLLELFYKYQEVVPMIPGGKAYRNVRSAEECAQKCKLYEGFSCMGFEHCGTKKTCVLHHRHALDLTENELGIGDSDCIHYAAKFMSDYSRMGSFEIKDGVFRREQGMNVEQCAKMCSQQVSSSCRSFNYCPDSMPGAGDSSCSMSSKSPLEKGIEPVTSEKCFLYTKKSDVEVEGWEKFKLDKVTSKKPSSNTAGVVIGTLIFGLAVGIALAVGYSYCRSKKGNDGMAVRFMK